MKVKGKMNLHRAIVAAVALAMVASTAIQTASARAGRDERRISQSQAPGKPVLAIVSLSDQRISIYDANGHILQSPVSTGSTGYETPAGIFTIVQKKEMHQSNLYEDGQMPFMQRITWTGIALHAGVLPGHPASHGCIRLPMAFAQHLFSLTDMGMRVLIVRDDMSPSDIVHPALFKSGPVRKEFASAMPRDRLPNNNAGQLSKGSNPVSEAELTPGSPRHVQVLQSIAAARTAEAEAASKRDREAKQIAAKQASQAADAARAVRAAEASVAKAEGALKDAERRLESMATAPPASQKEQATQRAEQSKATALARLGELKTQLENIQVRAREKQVAADQANEDAKTAAVARESAVRAAEEAARLTLPVSVFVSRKSQRLYVRRANYPVYEGPVTIRDPQSPIGTFVFTALNPVGTSGEMHWSVTALYPKPTSIDPTPSEAPRRVSTRYADNEPQPARRTAPRKAEAAVATDVAAAKAALDRIVFSPEALAVISDVVLAGSSLIISDEGPSRETGKDTDFVVVMSGEPQGALKIRQREPMATDSFGSSRSPFRGFLFPWD
jgi:hypothetical protein